MPRLLALTERRLQLRGDSASPPLSRASADEPLPSYPATFGLLARWSSCVSEQLRGSAASAVALPPPESGTRGFSGVDERETARPTLRSAHGAERVAHQKRACAATRESRGAAVS